MNNTIRIFKENFMKLLVLTLMIVLPVYLVQEVIIMPYFPAKMEVGDVRAIWYTLSIWLISLFLYVFRIAVIKLSYHSLEGKQSTISDLMDFSVRLWPKILLTTLLYAISVTCGLMLFFFPGIIYILSICICPDRSVGEKVSVSFFSLCQKKYGKSSGNCIRYGVDSLCFVICRYIAGRCHYKSNFERGNSYFAICTCRAALHSDRYFRIGLYLPYETRLRSQHFTE